MEHCSCTNCYNPIVAKGMCETHYRRMRKHGSTEQTRPADWGMKEKHPLYNSWGWIKKMRGRHEVDAAWEDFWTFVQDIGDRPTKQHSLRKLDESLGYVRGNLFWKEHLTTADDRAAYAREWRKANPDKAKNSNLKKVFGITLDDYNIMLKNQDYSCKICNKHEDLETNSLAVDHCHTTGKIRGLLCADCNRALGMFKDDTTILQNAINYLKD